LAGTDDTTVSPCSIQAKSTSKIDIILFDLFEIHDTRLATVAAADSAGLMPSIISFSKTLLEVKMFLRKITSQSGGAFAKLYSELIASCAKLRIDIRPVRSFPRDKIAYRRISRKLLKKRRGRKPQVNIVMQNEKPELLRIINGNTILLS
jgi:hypothetical protein